MDWNQSIFQYLFGLSGQSPFFDALGVFLAEYLPFFLIAAIFFFIFSQTSSKRRLEIFGFLTVGALFGWGLISRLLHFFLNLPRPTEVLSIESLVNASGAAFPSRHAALFFSLASGLFFFDERWGWWFLFLSTLVALARIYVGVHWPADIIGGFLAGILGTLLARLILGKGRL